MSNPDHPIWSIARILTIMLAIWLFSFVNASDFDITEWTMLGQFYTVLFGVEGALAVAKFRKYKNEQNTSGD